MMLTIKEVFAVMIWVIMLILCGCSTVPVQEVKIPITVPCLGPYVDEPVYEFGTGQYPGDAEAVKMLASDLTKSKQYSLDLITRMAGCK